MARRYRWLSTWTLLLAGWAGVVFFTSARETVSGQTPAPQQSYGSEDDYGYGSGRLTDEARAGRDTWYFWTGGNERFWVRMAEITEATSIC